MDNPLPSTPAGDTTFEEIDDSTQLEWDPKNDSVVLAQRAVETPITPLIPSTEAPQDAENPSTQDVQDPLVQLVGKFRPQLIELTGFKPKLLIRFIMNKSC